MSDTITRGTTTSRLPALVACLSLAYGVLGLLWLREAFGYPFAAVPPDGDQLSALSMIPEQFGAGLIAVLGFLGVPAALGHTRTEWSRSAYRPLLAFTAVQAVVFGLLATDVSVVIITGYLLVLLGLPVATGFLIAGAWRQPVVRLVLLGIVLMVVLLELTTGLFDWTAFRELGSGLADAPERVGARPLFVFGAFLLGCGWAVLGVRGLRSARRRCLQCGRPGARWTRPEVARRWGFWATVIAALCPLPYGLLRMTWLLPDPIGFDAADLEAQPGIRLFGLGLGLIALASGVATLGLIRPWGETWPRWIPFLAGRPVPLKAAVIPGATAATLLLVGGVSMIQVSWQGDASFWTNLGHLLIFPFPLWGTAVGLATAAYYYRRRSRCTTCGLD